MDLGSKIENLTVMKQNGLPVPDFFALPYSQLVPNTAPLKKAIRDSEEMPVSMRSSFLKNVLRQTAALQELPAFPPCLYAVRSSSGSEDSAENSFAGQFDTFLNVEAEDVPARVQDCLCSMFHENVLEYMAGKKLSVEELNMNVLVQRMVASDCSGVLFTANPQGLLNESVVIVGRGLGENVVSDRTDTTAYYYNTTDRVYYYDGKEDLLTREQLEELMAYAEKIRSLFGDYMDIEFAVQNGKIFILQARPITTLSAAHPLIFDNSNIVESYPGLSLPLTVSFVCHVYEGVFVSAGRRLLKNPEKLAQLQPVLGNTVGCVNGRMYYKISNWYEIIHCLPFHKVFMPIWQELIGVQYRDAFQASVSLSPFCRASIALNTVSELFRAPKNMEKLHEKFSGIYEYVTGQFRHPMTAKEILKLYDLIEEQILSDWGLTLINDTYAFLFTGLLKNRLQKKYSGQDGLANRYISGISNIESMKPVRAMIRLAQERASLSREEYEKRKAEYAAQYGDRSPEELKLESETFRTSPDLLEKKIAEYALHGDGLEQLLASFSGGKPVIREDVITKFLSRRATVGISHRERSRLNRSRIFGLVREAMLRLGELYAEGGCLEQKRDVLYLTMEEVRRLAEEPEDMRDTVEQRKQKYDMYAMLPAYSRLVFSGKEFNKNHRSINTAQMPCRRNEMQGIPCSDGVVEGEAYVVEDVKTAEDPKGKILITKMTDPGWVFLLAAAKGVVSEKGSLLSHTAIISRELKIPAVVGIDRLTSTIRTGDTVRLDGTTGVVKIVKRKAE